MSSRTDAPELVHHGAVNVLSRTVEAQRKRGLVAARVATRHAVARMEFAERRQLRELGSVDTIGVGSNEQHVSPLAVFVRTD